MAKWQKILDIEPMPSVPFCQAECHMPGAQGFEIIHIPTWNRLTLSGSGYWYGFSETERVREVQKLGVGAYVKKPYLLKSIGPAIRRVLDA